MCSVDHKTTLFAAFERPEIEVVDLVVVVVAVVVVVVVVVVVGGGGLVVVAVAVVVVSRLQREVIELGE